MAKFDRNAPLPADAAIAKEFIAAAQALAEIMTKAKRMGLECSFVGIRPNEQGVFKAHDIIVKKVVLEG